MGQIIDGAFYSDYDGQDIDERLTLAGGVSNLNLLDNAWFTINQRGFTTGQSADYTVDRWKIYNAKLTVNSDKTVTVRGLGDGALLNQALPRDGNENLIGKTTTISLLDSNGNLYSYTGVCPSSGALVMPWSGNLRLYLYVTNNYIAFEVEIRNNDTFTFRAVKLEIGTVSTLANDVAPNYDLELYKCKAYFRRLRSNNYYLLNGFASSTTQADFLNPFGTQPFAKTPVITFTGTHTVRNANANYTVNNMVVQENAEHIVTGIRMTTNATNMTGYTRALYSSDANSYIDISADY